MAKNEDFNWAILAPGKIAGKFADDLQYVNDAALYAVASRSLERAQSFADQYSIPHIFGNYHDLLNLDDIDCVYIASPHVFHYEHAMMCLDADLNVLCEKPFAMNQNQVNEMIAMAQSKNVFLMEALWTRFFPYFAKIQELIDSKVIGEIIVLEADFGFEAPYDPSSRLFDLKLGGGALLDIGIYPVFMALAILGYPDEIVAKATYAETGADQTNKIIFHYSNGKKAELTASIIEDTKCDCRLHGMAGTIEVNQRFHESKAITVVRPGRRTEVDCSFDGRGYRWEAAHVQDVIKQGLKESPIMSFDFSRQLIKLLDEIRGLLNIQYD